MGWPGAALTVYPGPLHTWLSQHALTRSISILIHPSDGGRLDIWVVSLDDMILPPPPPLPIPFRYFKQAAGFVLQIFR